MAAEATPLEVGDVIEDGGNRLAVEPDLAGHDIYGLVADRIDVMRSRPTLAAGVESMEFDLPDGGSYVMVANPDRSVHYRFAPQEAALLPYLDGARTVGEIVLGQLDDSGELDAAGVVELVDLLYVGGFLTNVPMDVYVVLDRALHRPTVVSRAEKFLRTLTVEWSGAERMVSGLYRVLLRYVFNPVGLAVAAALMVAGVAAFVDATATHDFRLTNRHFGVAFAVLLLLDLTIIFVHELGHATTLVHYGRRVRGAGFRIYFGSPSFFIDSGDALMMSTPRRIFQSAAGPIFEVVGTSIAAIALWAFPSGAVGRTLYQFIIINYFVLFLNLVPMLELDGYWILSDALHQPDLRPQSLAFVRADMWHKLRRRERFSRRDVGLAAFGLAGVAFTVFSLASAWFFWRRVFGDTVSAMWGGGLGGKLLLLALALLLGGPVIRLAIGAARSVTNRVRSLIDRLRFRFETGWRVEAASLLDESTLFGDVPAEILSDIAGRVQLRTLAPGAVLMRQGDPADAYYIVRRGSLEVVEELPDGRTRVLNTEGRGGGIGDQGLLEGSPRSATVRALERTAVFQIDKATFDRLLTDRATRPAFAPTVQRISELRQLRPFGSLGSEALAELSGRGRWLNLAPDDTLFEQGDAGDAFYVVDHGRLAVSVDGREVRVLGPGDHVGELALLFDAPRSASVRALTPVRLFAVDRPAFESLVADQFRRGAVRMTVRVESIRDH